MKQIIYLFSLVMLVFSACKSTDDLYIYEVNEVEVTQPGIDKNSPKTDLEFISLAYSDLFGKTISNDDLNRMVLSYNALGDKSIIADLLIRNMLNSPQADVPSAQEMRNDIEGFITDTFKKFYVREPGEYELWYFRSLIESDPDITPELIYYAFLTSDEYRFY
ncbi:MAG: hypothetical protein KDD99_23190 [Bacteroidetes bacterium]|nr:hypothetical protein [Bacteroidota bacterium]